MRKLKFRVGGGSVLAVAFLVASCGKPAPADSARVEFTDVTASNALARVDALERRIGELEQQLKRNKAATDAAIARTAAASRSGSGDLEALKAFRRRTLERLDRIEARQGT